MKYIECLIIVAFVSVLLLVPAGIRQPMRLTKQVTIPKVSPEPKKIVQAPKVTSKPKPRAVVKATPPSPPVRPPTLTSHEALMAQAGIASSDFDYVDYIVTHESDWQVDAVEPTTFATGLCQSLPASKMSAIASDYLTNPITQLRWCALYASQRYSSWHNAYIFWENNRYW